MAPLQQVAPAGESMSRDQPKTKPMSANMNAVAALFNMQPLNYNAPTIVKEQVPGATMLGPYKAPEAHDEIIGYELFFPRDCGGPFACNISGMRWIDACFDTCCYPCSFGPGGLCCILSGVGACLPCFMKKYQNMCQRPVYGKKGTDITKLVPHSSYLYVESVNDHKA